MEHWLIAVGKDRAGQERSLIDRDGSLAHPQALQLVRGADPVYTVDVAGGIIGLLRLSTLA